HCPSHNARLSCSTTRETLPPRKSPRPPGPTRRRRRAACATPSTSCGKPWAMTDHDDKLHRAYRALGNEEPPAALDAAILARARERVVPRRRPSWMVPVSIAAVLVL